MNFARGIDRTIAIPSAISRLRIVEYGLMPKVSVIIPTYNCAQFLGQAIESAWNQTFHDLEIVVVDDGSTDDTAQVVRAYDSKIRYLRQDNRGLPAARNNAIKASSGELIALLDADDWWEPTKLAEQVPILLEDPDLCLVYSDLEVVFEDGSINPSFLSSRPLASSGYVFDHLLSSSFILPSTVLLRRNFFEQVGMFDESMRSHEDIELWLRMCQRWKVALVRKPLTHRRQGTANMTSDGNLRTEYGIKLWEKSLLLPNLTTGQHQAMTEQLDRSHFARGYYYFTEGQMQECRVSMPLSLDFRALSLRAWMYYGASFLPAPFISLIRKGKKQVR